jgi:predicted MFS family arabinose efflux permease
MVAWMLVVCPGGRMADRWGRRPLLILAWTIMAVRLLFVALATSLAQIVLNQFLDGAANGLFSVVAATWVTDRLADPRRNGEAQVLVGTSLVLGSAIGPAIAGMFVDQIGYRALFACLAGIGAIATAVIVLFVPETLHRDSSSSSTLNIDRAFSRLEIDATVPS